MRALPLLLLTALLAASLRAGCGLENCPSKGIGPWETSAAVASTRFDWAGRSGSHVLFTTRAVYRGKAPWTFGGAVPAAVLTEGGRRSEGLSNPVLFGERSLTESPTGALSAGLQAELPAGHEEMGVAAGHVELLPYFSVEKTPGAWCFSVRLGGRFALDAGHEEEAPEGRPLLVNPHADKEILYRLGVSDRRTDNAASGEVFLDGQHALGAEAGGPGFLTGGLSFLFPLDEGVEVRLGGEQALTRPRRFENRVSLAVACRR